MPNIVVIGGGFGGMASAARLAKLGHSVTLLERSTTPGGAMSSVSQDGFTWDAGASSTLLPAVLRDLFRKTGRPLEKELDLVPALPTHHRFADRTSVFVPGGSRSAQLEAMEGLGRGLGQMWIDYVAEYAEPWELLRRDFLERPFEATVASAELRRLLDSRESLQNRVNRALKDPRLRSIAAYPLRLQGHDPGRVPAWAGFDTYLAQRFGEWTVPGGLFAVTSALSQRLATRGVTVLAETAATDLVVHQGAVRAVRTDAGELTADLVVCAVSPDQLPQLRRHLRRTQTTAPPDICHLAIQGGLPWPSETVIHGREVLVVRPGQFTDDVAAVTLLSRGVGDPIDALAKHGLDLRARIVARIDRDSRSQATYGSAYGVQWRGRGTIRRRLGPTTPIKGVYLAGAHANPGAGVPMVGLSAALVAQAIGPND